MKCTNKKRTVLWENTLENFHKAFKKHSKAFNNRQNSAQARKCGKSSLTHDTWRFCIILTVKLIKAKKIHYDEIAKISTVRMLVASSPRNKTA